MRRIGLLYWFVGRWIGVPAVLAGLGAWGFLAGAHLQGAPVSIWPDSTVPALIDGGADKPVELGLKFRSDVAGTITGIRFYKSAANTGMHVGSLWSNNGTRLGSVTFSAESASGWQQATLSSPVPVQANTVYVVSYHANNGHYSASLDFFASRGTDSGPLHALASGVAGGNGVYVYGANPAFPALTWRNTNYWVDVVFEPATQADVTPPYVIQVSTGSGSSGVSNGAVLQVRFNEGLNPGTVNNNNISVRDTAGTLVSGSIVYSAADFTVSLSPSAPLKAASTYTLLIKGGTGGIADLAGNAMAADFSWVFTTQSFGAKGGGPGGPVLILTDPANPFSEYFAEILLAEGLNCFGMAQTSTMTASLLSRYDVVLLGQVALTDSQVTLISDWVSAGGKLIASRPDKKLAGLLGLRDTGQTIQEGYLLVDTAKAPGAGIVSQTMQFHGVADLYSPVEAISLAQLYRDAETGTAFPAVSSRNVGSNGGRAVAFAYDLARSVVYTRQGNPAWVGENRDGLTPARSNDLFYGAASFDPQPDWVDLRRVAIPQADEQQRLLANLIITLEADKRIIPRFWYFPDNHRAVVVMTGDDHANGGTPGRFDQYQAASNPATSAATWGAIRGTSYVYPNEPMTNTQAAAYAAAGFEIGLHLNTGCADYTAQSADEMLTDQLLDWRARFPGLPAPTTNRVHCIAWSGYTTMPEIELLHGIRLDTSYYYYPPEWVADRPGVFTGSGLPMRFATAAGDAIDVFQAATQMTDESNQRYPYTVDTLLDRATGPEGFYGAFVANMHTDFVSSAGSDAILSSAQSRGIPVITARQLLEWTDARNRSAFSSLSGTNTTATFSVEAPAEARGLRVLVPVPGGRAISSVRFNGTEIPYSQTFIKGLSYLNIQGLSGSYAIEFGADSTPPAVTSVQPVSGASGVPVTVQPSLTFSEPLDPASVTGSTVSLRDAANVVLAAAVTYDSGSFKVTLAPAVPLAATSVYTLVIKGGSGGVSDLAGNRLAADAFSTFTTGTTPVATTYSLWNENVIPATVSVNDNKSVTLGLKFRTSTAGKVTAIRFYKGSRNTGTHTGTLWTASGSVLASVTFSGETASGWQTQKLNAPVSLAANTTYVVSYHAPVGWYAANSAYFSTGGWVSGPLRALSSVEAGTGNGVYFYGPAGPFPTQSFNGTNYWVDVVFEAGL